MIKNKKVDLIDNENGADIEEKSYLMVTDEVVGVTNSLGDIWAYIKEKQETGKMITILPGYKEELLTTQHRILLMDEIDHSINRNSLDIPKRFTDYNLVERQPAIKDVNGNILISRLIR